jgi:F-type H+-transporting ATPase subunit gamma
MATLREIKFRIRAARNIQQITKAMKLVAAARLRRAHERIIQARPYAHKMEEVLGRMVCHTAAESHPLLTRRNTGRQLLLLVTADKGLCGSFNHNTTRQGWEWVERSRREGKENYLAVVGRKGKEFLRGKRWVPLAEYINIFARLSYAHAARIAQDILRFYDELQLEEVFLLYNEFKSAGRQKLVCATLLPIDPSLPDACPVPSNYSYEPSAQVIFQELLPKYAEVQIFHALLESAAAEQDARMTAMQMATQNAGEMINRLSLLYNKARQERITKELLELVAGGEALKSG